MDGKVDARSGTLNVREKSSKSVFLCYEWHGSGWHIEMEIIIYRYAMPEKREEGKTVMMMMAGTVTEWEKFYAVG